MATIVQLHTVIPVDTPKGKGDVHLVIDQGREHNLQFVTFIRETGECWTFQSTECRLEKNITEGIRKEGSGHEVVDTLGRNLQYQVGQAVRLATGSFPMVVVSAKFDRDESHSPAYQKVTVAASNDSVKRCEFQTFPAQCLVPWFEK